MKAPGSDLVRVRSASELRPGMTVVTKDCARCGREHVVILLRSHESPMCRLHGVGNCVTWDNAPKTHRKEGWWCVATHIAEGRLFRLRDLDDQQERSTEKHREVTA